MEIISGSAERKWLVGTVQMPRAAGGGGITGASVSHLPAKSPGCPKREEGICFLARGGGVRAGKLGQRDGVSLGAAEGRHQ